MINLLRRLRKDTQGQAIAELAITLPVLLLILCGIIDFGWLYTNQLALSYCSREGARYAVVHATEPGALQNAKDRTLSVAPDFLRDKMTVTVAFTNVGAPRTGDVRVLVTAGIEALTPVMGVFEQGQLVTLSSQCVMRVE